jgi:hypothetical protein
MPPQPRNATRKGNEVILLLRELYFFPLTPNDSGANILSVFSFAIHFIGQENLLETHLSVSRVLVYVTIQQAAVSESLIAKAIARLLGQHFRNPPRCFVSFFLRRMFELAGIKRFRKRFRFIWIVKKMRDALCDLSRRRRRLMIAVRGSCNGVGCRMIITSREDKYATGKNYKISN